MIDPFEPYTIELPARIRFCRGEDLPTLEWFGMFPPGLLNAVYQRYQDGYCAMLVADVNDVASGQLWVELGRYGEPAGILWALRVFPNVQGQGVGTRLVAAGEWLLRDQGFAYAELSVDKENLAARRLYKRLGYAEVPEPEDDYIYVGRQNVPVHIPGKQWLLRKTLTAPRVSTPPAEPTWETESYT